MRSSLRSKAGHSNLIGSFRAAPVERKLRRRQLTEDGNVEITGRDLRESSPAAF